MKEMKFNLKDSLPSERKSSFSTFILTHTILYLNKKTHRVTFQRNIFHFHLF